MEKEFNVYPTSDIKKIRKIEFVYGMAAGLIVFVISTAFLFINVRRNTRNVKVNYSEFPMTTLMKIFNINVHWIWMAGMGALAILVYYVAAHLATRKAAQGNSGIRTGVWGGLICGLCGLLLWIILTVWSIVSLWMQFSTSHPPHQTAEGAIVLGMALRPYPQLPYSPLPLIFLFVYVLLALILLLPMALGYYLLIMGLLLGLIGGVVANWTGKRSRG